MNRNYVIIKLITKLVIKVCDYIHDWSVKSYKFTSDTTEGVKGLIVVALLDSEIEMQSLSPASTETAGDSNDIEK
jgi:hypothetical protein